MSEQNALNDQEMPELPRRNSSHHSYSKSLGVADAVSVQETTPAETTTPASAPTKLPPEVSLHRLAHLNKPEIPVLLLGTIAAVANGLILPVHGILLSNTIKIFYEPEDKLCKDSIFWALAFIVLGVASLLAQPSKSYLFAIAGCKLIRRIRSKCFEKVVYMEVSWFDEAKHSSGALGARLSADAAFMRGVVGDALALLVQNIATAIAGMVIAFTANWLLALIIFVLLPLFGVRVYVEMKFMQRSSADAKVCFKLHSQLAPMHKKKHLISHERGTEGKETFDSI